MTQPAAKEGPPSVWEDLLEILYAPRAVFVRRVDYQAFGLAMLILTVVSAAIFFATRSSLSPVMDATVKLQVAEALRQNPQITEEMAQSIGGWIRTSISATLIVAPIFFPLVGGLLLWFVGKFFDSKVGFGGAMMIATYAYVPRMLGFLASSIVAVVLPEERLTSFFSISFSAAHFADPAKASQAVVGALARFDLFLFWCMAITAIGISVLGKVSMGRAAAIAFIVWALGFVVLIPAALAR